MNNVEDLLRALVAVMVRYQPSKQSVTTESNSHAITAGSNPQANAFVFSAVHRGYSVNPSGRGWK